ncbi:OmpA family protein [Chitinophaga sp. Hz27]|uniref:OmpA family protein n=1 Tax=Chitinophaga sp. Hz27 TaxID=3347169 RepID=UPI0035DAC3DF
MKKYYLHISLLTVTALGMRPLMAQSPRSAMAKADALFSQQEYFAAAQLYEQCYTGKALTDKHYAAPFSVKKIRRKSSAKKYNNADLAYKAAESYRQCFHYQLAADWYARAVAENSHQPQLQYWYAVTLRATGHPDAAKAALLKFRTGLPDSDAFARAAAAELEHIDFAARQQVHPDIKATILHMAGDSLTAVSALSWKDADHIIFTGVVPHGAAYANKLYQAVLKDGNVSAVQPLEIAQENGQYAAGSFTPDRNTIFFTRWEMVAEKKQASIYSSTLTAGKWSAPERIDAIVNLPGYNAMQPFVTTDGKHLLFSSDRPGGAGQYDIWTVALNGGKVIGAALNAGTNINTAGDEVTPYYDMAAQYLYFSSDGRPGMGGLDVYRSVGPLETPGMAENMGLPVNTVKHDAYFTLRPGSNGKEAALSSDRNSDCCLGIVLLQFPPEPPKVVEAPPVVAVTPPPVVVQEKKDTSWFIHFDFDKSVLKPDAIEVLDELARMLKADATLNTEIFGHTDGKGSDDYNNKLADLRAKVCIQYLLKQGIDPARISGQSFGKRHLLKEEKGNDDASAREMNRRVECRVFSSH